MIKKVSLKDDFDQLSQLLNDAFRTVAYEFGLTEENAPTNNAFITSEELKTQLIERRQFFCYIENDEPIGFIAIEKSQREIGTFYIEKVAVLPNYRHKKIGLQLMSFATNRISEQGGKKISIGIIDSNIQLKKWYSKQNFVEVGVKEFEHLPFAVCYMEKYL